MLENRSSSERDERSSSRREGERFRRLKLPLPVEVVRDLIEVHEFLNSVLTEQKLFRPPTSPEIARALRPKGYTSIADGQVRQAFKSINRLREAEGLPPLELSASSMVITGALIADAHAEAKKPLDREPAAEEVARVLSSRLGRKITVKTVRSKAAEYNATRSSEGEQLHFAPANFRCGYYPSDVQKQYNQYVKKHRRDSTPHTRHPRYQDLVRMVKEALPESRPTLVNMCSAVRFLRREGHKVPLRNGPAKMSKSMLVRAIAEERERCKKEGEKVSPGGIARALNSRYPGLNISAEMVSKRARRFHERAQNTEKQAFEFDRKPLELDKAHVERVYNECSKAVKDIIPFPSSVEVASKIGSGEGAARSHLREINAARAQRKLLPYLYAQNISARDLRYLVAAFNALQAGPLGSAAAGKMLSHMVRQSPHHGLEVFEQIVKRAQRDGVTVRPGATTGETARNYRVGLIWALARSVLSAKEVDAAVKRGLETASHWTIPKGIESELRYFQSASIALELAFQEGRLAAPTVQERLSQLLIKHSDFGSAARVLDRLIQDILEPSGLTAAVSIDDQEKLSSEMLERLRQCGGNFNDALPEGVAERGAWFQTLIGRSLRTSDKEKLRVIAEIRSVQLEQGLDFESAVLSMLYEPSIVSGWVLSEKLLHVRVRATKYKREEQQEKAFLGKSSKQDAIRVLDEIRGRLQEGESLDEVLEEFSIPHRLYNRLTYYHRALSTSCDERLSILHRIAAAVANGANSLEEVLVREQIPPAVFAHWMRRADEYRRKITNPDRRRAIHYFLRAYPRQKRESLMADISRDLDSGITLSDALQRRCIPHDIYSLFTKLASRRHSGVATLKALTAAALKTHEPSGKSVTRQLPESAGSVLRARVEVRSVGTAEWAEQVILAIQSAERDGGRVTQTLRSVTRGVARAEIVKALRELLRLRWDELPAIDEQILSCICVMRTSSGMLDVNALFGARFVSPDTDYKERIMQRRAELELPIFHELDA
jgi:hypothetical protein